jgi:glycopeptide antibiotics resistance protein
MYVMFSLDRTFFPIQINGVYVDVMRQTPLMSRVNLVPLYFGQYGLTAGVLSGIIDNIILTVPFGFGLNFISRVRMRAFFWLSITIGLGIEVSQFVISLILRYPYRVVDINDLLLNAAGVLIGYGFFRLFAWFYLAITQKFGIKHRGLPAYILNVASQALSTGRLKSA